MARTRKRSQSARPARAAAAPAASTAAATSAPTAMHVLSADLRIAACAAERDALLKASDGQDLMTVDGGAVTRVDATGLQLLVALCRHQRDRGGAVRWLQVSEALRAAARISGLTAALCLPDA